MERRAASELPLADVAEAGDLFRVAFILVPGFSMMALSAAVEPLRAANRLAGRPLYAWSVIADRPGPVLAGNGLELTAEHGFADAPIAGLSIVVASLDVDACHDPELFAHLRSLRRRNRLTGAISNGALLLARAGLTAGRKVTIHWETHVQLQDDFPDVEVLSQLYCLDGDLLTAGGGTAALDMMLAFIAARDGPQMAADVAEQFLHGPARPPDGTQRLDAGWRYGVTDRRIVAAIRLMENHIAPPLRIARLAGLAGVSERQLERLFGASFGRSPSEFYMEIRLNAACGKLAHTTMTIEEIAESTGFSSQAHFSRAIKSWCGASPLAIRRRAASGHVGKMHESGDTA